MFASQHSLGLGGYFIDIIPPAVNKDKKPRNLFGIKKDQKLISSIIIGYPKYKHQRGIRRNLKNIKWI